MHSLNDPTYVEHFAVLIQQISVPRIHLEVGAIVLKEHGPILANATTDLDQIRQILAGNG